MSYYVKSHNSLVFIYVRLADIKQTTVICVIVVSRYKRNS
jgi:hypothetical protein